MAIPPEALLGRRVRDRISGLTGTITGIATYLIGLPQALVVPFDASGLRFDCHWIEVYRLTVLDEPEAIEAD